MILSRQPLIVPDGIGKKLPRAITASWPAGSDVALLFQIVHSDESVYDLSGDVEAIMSFNDGHGEVLELDWIVTSTALGHVMFTVTRAQLPEGRYAVGVRFKDDDTGFEDQITGECSRVVVVVPRIAKF